MPLFRTYGRNPTLAEVKDYYSREDILVFLSDACKKRKIIFSFKDEPSLGSEARSPHLESQDTDSLRETILERIDINLRGISDGNRLRAYPSFHSLTGKGDSDIEDFVMEADCPGWRRSFVDVRGAVEILNEFRVRYIAKFSGHRSLHLMIPREAFPEMFDDVPISHSWKNLEKRMREFFNKYAKVRYAHGTGGILRLPYSLNENTGMVSLPITYDELDDFRPWETIPHLVSNVSLNLFEASEKDKEKTSEFLKAVLIDKSVKPLKSKIWNIRPKQNIDKYRGFLKSASLDSDDPLKPAEGAWRLMIGGNYISNEVLEKYSQDPNPDVRWFMAEALMGDERAWNFLHETDEYAANAIIDSVSTSSKVFLEKLLSFSEKWEHSLGIMANVQAISERLADALRDEILNQAGTVDEKGAYILLKIASVLGGTDEDWETIRQTASILNTRFPDVTEVISQDVLDNMKGLMSDDWKEAEAAEKAMTQIGSRATDMLIMAMGNPGHWFRKRVFSILCKVGDARAIPCMVSALGDPGGKIRGMAISGILRLPQETEELRELLMEASNTDNTNLRANAIKVLRIIDEALGLQTALSSLEDREWKVRQTGVKSLGKIGGPKALEGLKKALMDESIKVTFSAALALSDMGDKGLDILRNALAGDNFQTARCAAHALIEAGDNRGINLVIDCLKDDNWDEWPTPFTLAESGTEEASETLAMFINQYLHTEEISSKALRSINALGRCKGKIALETLKQVIYARKDRKSRRNAFSALQEIGTSDAIEVMLDALVSDNGNLRQYAGNALIKMNADILPKLEELSEKIQGKAGHAVISVLEALQGQK